MLNEFGQEIPDDTPVVIHFRGRTVSQFDQVREYIRSELSRQASGLGMETLEEANDFDVEDDLFPVSAHEYDRDTEEADLEALRRGDPRTSRPAAPAGGAAPAGSPPAGGNPAAEAGDAS